MNGSHHIIVQTEKVRYEFNIKRNITIIQGDSATGKTTLVDILAEYSRMGDHRGIRLESDVPCAVYSGSESDWEYELKGLSGRIVFFDEDYKFIYSREFAAFLQSADNYFVFITRKPIKTLPYSISEIYGIRTTGKYHFPEQVYHEFYPLYDGIGNADTKTRIMVLVEDAEAGYQFYSKLVGEKRCLSANGNSNVYLNMIKASETGGVLVIADGAAFGAYIDNVVKYSRLKGNIALFFPESFEWMILKSEILDNSNISYVLAHPEEYIDSSEYPSWERFFTALLIEKTKDDAYKRYSKSHLPDYYTQGKNLKSILRVIPEEIRELL